MVTGKNWKVRKDGKPKMDENTQARFDEKLTGLLAVARKKKNVLEYQEVVDYARFLGMTKVYIQEGECASKSFIPDFDYQGVEKNSQ